ncbi:MAG: ABC transporter ATP-binding protein [Desulfomonilia bacterium]|jgi:branched-chain amino acid transport system ATP-binding protein|uniref:Leucine/isoleucine/valine transporter subunit ATP-binding component of ABC superfamily n=1 Tax=anaerobic digester metagenome TaxID=1263854 RepID=A0A485M171_9ZZZZ|nr:ABC transporter ATP-binding protein [Pseudomonadota bacterium]HON38352.1 ABC transporter ATP-binding protein [Deltaproteobacteria bacterium]HRS56510.1 ABC transporter ATP-binding protein [Desulfomonilia bacterium]HPD21665.1 ABC transporter ATP-binding protein [Deltaproteobacteria bacterium]HPX18323.1 ABC transporter ATP-binding protein [Deltaproteobacteria bacterium]
MLKVKNLHTYYGGIHALKSVSFDLPEGEIITLIGANGAGKSTTLMSISGIVPPRYGEIIFLGTPIHQLSPDRIFALGIVQVPEGRRIFPQLTVRENLDMGAYLRTDRKGIAQDIDYIFNLFPRLAERRHQLGGTLSGGEQQMLAISRGLMSRPKLLLLDEPSLGLAPVLVQLIFATIEKINRENKTTIFLVEQNANMALRIAHRGYVMESGVITLEDTAANLLKSEKVKQAYLGL